MIPKDGSSLSTSKKLRGGQRVLLSALPRGLYIIHVGKSTFKVAKK